MPTYLFRGSLSPEGVAATLDVGGSARRDAVKAAIEALGGTLETYYYTFGEQDSLAICQLPDNATAAAFAMQASATGRVSATTTVLLTPEEIDDAGAKENAYRAPGA
jgi:uncharacterized protein with GYD domain